MLQLSEVQCKWGLVVKGVTLTQENGYDSKDKADSKKVKNYEYKKGVQSS